VQAIGATGQGLILDRDRVGEGDGCILICSRPPHAPVGNYLSPELAAIRQGSVIVDSDIGNADALHDYRVLALPRQVQHQALARGGLGDAALCRPKNA